MDQDEVAAELARLPRWYDVSLVVWPRAGYRCEYCGRNLLASLDEYRWGWNHDHLIPRSVSQDDSNDNMVLSCVACNRYKDTFDPHSVAGPDASRDDLIAAASKKIEELRSADQQLLEQVRHIVSRDSGPATAPSPAP